MAPRPTPSTMDPQPGPREQRLNSNASDTTISDAGDAGASDAATLPQTKRRRRVSMTAHQTRTLNAVFERTCFPSTELRRELASKLGLEVRVVQVWFQNRRQRLRENSGLTRGRSRQLAAGPRDTAQSLTGSIGYSQIACDAPTSSPSSSTPPQLSPLQPSPPPFAATYYPPYQWLAGFPPARHSRTRSDISPHVAAAIRNDIYRRHLGYQMFAPPLPPPAPFYHPQLHPNAAPLMPPPMSVGSPGELYHHLPYPMEAPSRHPHAAALDAISLPERGRKRNSA